MVRSISAIASNDERKIFLDESSPPRLWQSGNVQWGKKQWYDSGVGVCETRSDIKGSLRRRK